MLLRKIAGATAAGAMVLGGVAAMSAPAQATTGELALDANYVCKGTAMGFTVRFDYSPTLVVTADGVEVSTDATSIGALYNDATGAVMNGAMFKYDGIKLDVTTSLNDEDVVLSGAYATSGAAGSGPSSAAETEVGALTGTRTGTADLLKGQIADVDASIDLYVGYAGDTYPVALECEGSGAPVDNTPTVEPTVATVSFDGSCKYSSFPAMAFASDFDVTVDGTDVTAVAKSPLNLGFAIDLDKTGATLVLDVDGEEVTVSGIQEHDPAVKGDVDTVLPELVGTRMATAAASSVTLKSVAVDLKLFGQEASAPCTATVEDPDPEPTVATVSFDGSCKYSSFPAMAFASDFDVTVDGTDVTAVAKSPLNLGFAIDLDKTGATLVLDVDGEEVTVSGIQEHDPAVKGDVDTVLPELVGTRTATAVASSVTLKSVAVDLKLFGQEASAPCAATVEDPDPAVETTTTATATSPSANTVTIDVDITPGAAGRINFFNKETEEYFGGISTTDGKATFTKADVPAGDYTFEVRFAPTDTDAFVASSTDVTVTVADPVAEPEVVETSTALVATSATANTVALKATVRPADASGHVEFFHGTTKLGEVAVAGGVAAHTQTGVAAGSQSYTAKFVPADADAFATSEAAAVSVTVKDAVKPQPKPPVAKAKNTKTNTKVKFQAKKKRAVINITVKAGKAKANGKVRIVVKQGKKVIFKKTVKLNKNGKAKLVVKKGKLKKRGVYKVNANYTGNKNFKKSKAKVKKFRVRR